MERSDDVANVRGRHNEIYLREGIDRSQSVEEEAEDEIAHLSTTGMPSMGQMTPESNSVG